MGEKEIKPADPKPVDQGGDKPYGGTQEKPGTGTPNPKPEQPSNQGGGDKGSGKSGGGGGSYTGSVQFEDGYRMGVDENGHTFLEHPDGSRATWDFDKQSWKGASGQTMGSDWSQGHRPTDFGPQH
ncbi:MAG TPA: hypothetical protein VFC31_06590 [Candidatus Limnocylindria bacterium]|nr:hypothetical protein [Candidatus Limnocylindria bacterium]